MTTIVILAVAVACAAAGCAPSPAPSPSLSSTGFASDAEAFAAAEATYRAYVDATNARRADPNSVPDPTDFLTGEAFNDEATTEAILNDREWRVVGETTIASFRQLRADHDRVELEVCLDSSGTMVLDLAETDVTPSDRMTIQALSVSFTRFHSSLLITQSKTSASQC